MKGLIMKYLIMMVIVGMLSSCSIGIKTKNTIIYSSLSKPINYKGLIRVATNDKIKVTVDNKPAELDCGGYYLVHKADLKKLLDIAKGVK